MSIDKKRNALDRYANDLLALETHFMKAVSQQRNSEQVTDNRVIELLHELDKMVSGHVNALKGRAEAEQESGVTAEIKKKIASFTGSVAGLIDRARTDTVSKMLRDNYTALSMITVGYTMLHTHAIAREDHLLAEMSQSHLMDCTSMIKEVSKVVPLAVAAEVTDDADQAEDVGRRALDNTQAAWSSEVVNREPDIV